LKLKKIKMIMTESSQPQAKDFSSTAIMKKKKPSNCANSLKIALKIAEHFLRYTERKHSQFLPLQSKKLLRYKPMQQKRYEERQQVPAQMTLRP
jgi:hypothetical protein